jgi:hypothetical protein
MRAKIKARKPASLKCPYCQEFYIEGHPHLPYCEKRKKESGVVNALTEVSLPINPKKKPAHYPKRSKRGARVMVTAPLSKQLVELVERIDLALEESYAKL